MAETMDSSAERELRCPVCGRFIGGVAALTHHPIPTALLRVRLYCPVCQRWRRFDPATGGSGPLCRDEPAAITAVLSGNVLE